MEAAIESAPEPEPQGDGDGGEPADDEPPLPGGVGFGVFYHPTYKTAFETGTAAEYTVICPTRPGGNVHSWLYLAATNRAARCPEAVVAYHGQDEFVFAVFDWARPEHWQAPLSPPQIREYLHEVVLDGSAYPALHVLTFTEQSGDGRWRNEVYLRHPEVGTFDMIHAFEYGATVVDQHLGWEGSWGPIIETFQGRYRDTEELGFACFSVASRGAAGWEPWERLSPTDTFVARDDAGFRMLYLEPNHTFVAAA